MFDKVVHDKEEDRRTTGLIDLFIFIVFLSNKQKESDMTLHKKLIRIDNPPRKKEMSFLRFNNLINIG